MTGINVNIDAESVKAEVVKAIMESTVGETITTEIKRHLSDYKAEQLWRRVVEREVEQVATLAIREEIKKHEADIRARVSESIDSEVISRITNKVVDHLWSSE